MPFHEPASTHGQGLGLAEIWPTLKSLDTLVFRSGPVAPGVAFVTGGARGLGNAIAVSFAKEGARGVVIVDIQDEQTMCRSKKAVEAFGVKACLLDSVYCLHMGTFLLIICY